MCSRYEFVPDAAAWADFRTVLGALGDELLALEPRPKLAPTDLVPIVVREPGGALRLIRARWGFIPQWWRRPEPPTLCFNARSEEAAAKPMWRDALRRGRCLIPATAWTEWQKAPKLKIPHRLVPGTGQGFVFAGLWSLWRARPDAEPMASCAILTTAASSGVAHVHERMPVVLAPEGWMDWLDPGRTDSAEALALLARHGVGGIAATPIERR